MYPINSSVTDLVDPIIAQHQARIRAEAKAARHTGPGRLPLGAALLMAVLAVVIVSATPVDVSATPVNARVRSYLTSSMPAPPSKICPYLANPHSPDRVCPQVTLWVTDKDEDGLSNAAELAVFGTDPRANDTDGDNLSDFGEVYRFGTNPLERDTDGDGLSDGQEVVTFGTDPRLEDTDGDGISDLHEVAVDPLPPGIQQA